MKTEIVRNVPQWAVCYIAYGDDSGLTEEDKKMVDTFLEGLTQDGWNICESPIEGSENSFCRYPQFGLSCETVDYEIYK